jgi:AraC-like DNA-binding protein
MTQSCSPTVSGQVLIALVSAFEAFGATRASLLRQLQLEEAVLQSAKTRVSLAQLDAFFERAVAALSDPALGLHWAERLQIGAFAPVSHLLASTGTLRKGLKLIEHFAPLFCDAPAYEFLEHRDELTFQLADWRSGSAVGERVRTEMLLGGLLKMIRGSFSPLATPRHATVRYSAPPHHAEYERLLGCPVTFAQPRTTLVFEQELLDRPSPHSDKETHTALRAVAEQRLARINQEVSYTVRLRLFLGARLPQRVSMHAAAVEFGVSERSLRRHLDEEGSSYREIENSVMEQSAKHFLIERRMTIKETANAMGFTDVAAFHRAFKAWTGLTPSEYRARA